ncbi:MAG: RDD family protein [Cyclobacteriaceae bacterium]
MSNDILDLNNKDTNLVQASKGKRFANYLIDMTFFIVFYVILLLIVPILSEDNPITDRVIPMILSAIYYLILETTLKGKTIGKYITKTRVVTLDGETPDFGTMVKRSFSRAVPFDALSFLGEKSNGWHDKWSDTMVIDEKLSHI